MSMTQTIHGLVAAAAFGCVALACAACDSGDGNQAPPPREEPRADAPKPPEPKPADPSPQAEAAPASLADLRARSDQARRGKELLDLLGTIAQVEYTALEKRYQQDPKQFLFADHLTSLDAPTAQALATFEGHCLVLNGLEALEPGAAAALAAWPGQVLILNGVSKLTPETAAALAGFKGQRLLLDGLAELPEPVAVELAAFEGAMLSLRGLRNFPPASAAAMSKRKGAVSIKLSHDKPKAKRLTADERVKLRDLVQAIHRGDPGPIQAYLKAGGDPEFGEKGNTLLMEAAYQKQPAVVAALIAGGADVNADNGAGDTPLSFALQVPMFTRDPKTADPDRRRAVAKALIEAGATLKIPPAAAAKQDTPLHLAAKAGDLELVELMLAKGADADAAGRYGSTPLLAAINKGHLPVVRRLIKAGAEINPEDPGPGGVPLIQAVSQGATDISMVEFKAERAKKKVTPKGKAALTRKWLGIVDLLVESGADIDAKSDRGWPVLFSAINGGQPAILKRVLKHKPDLKAKGPKGETALQFLAANGRLKEPDLIPLARVLVKARANRRAKNAEGKTASQIAAARGFKKLARILK